MSIALILFHFTRVRYFGEWNWAEDECAIEFLVGKMGEIMMIGEHTDYFPDYHVLIGIP